MGPKRKAISGNKTGRKLLDNEEKTERILPENWMKNKRQRGEREEITGKKLRENGEKKRTQTKQNRKQ